jgi:hypothetical protein
MPLKPCPGCGRLVPTSQERCAECAEGHWRTRKHGVRASGKRSPQWQKVARKTLERDATCTRCRHHASKYAVHLDGVKANEEGGLDPDRVVGMCGACEAAYRRLLTKQVFSRHLSRYRLRRTGSG